MTKKDYELIAKAVYGSRMQSDKLEWQDRFNEQHQMTARWLANVLGTTNPRFDRDRFMAACGVTEKSG